MEKETTQKIEVMAIDGHACEHAFLRSGKAPEHLVKFLKKYPAANYLSWVKDEIASWIAANDFDSIQKLLPGKGNRRDDTGLKQCFIDFSIYRESNKLQKKGLKLTERNGVFETLTNHNFYGSFFSFEQLRRRYYRFVNREPATFVDGDTIICGPTRVDICGTSCMGFWRLKIESGLREL